MGKNRRSYLGGIWESEPDFCVSIFFVGLFAGNCEVLNPTKFIPATSPARVIESFVPNCDNISTRREVVEFQWDTQRRVKKSVSLKKDPKYYDPNT